MHALTKPKYFMPVHGEYRHLIHHKELAEGMGMSASNIFVSDIGKVVEIDEKGARFGVFVADNTNLNFNIMAYVISDDCVACGTCIDECPQGAISEGEKYSINPELCIDCGSCASVCPSEAIHEG